jgi:hypothetical protein
MNRFLTCTALGLVLGMTPALAQQAPADDAANPPALEQPVAPEAVPSEPAAPSDPAAPVPGDTSEMAPSQPDATLPQASEAPQSIEPATPPSSSAEAPQSIEPAAPKSAEASSGTQFLLKQESGDYLASNLIGKSVYNSQDEVIGDINDLVSDESGKIVGVLIGSGGFLGMGEKDVAIRFEELKLARDENNDVKVIANLDQDTLASAPDYEKLSEQAVSVGASGEASDQRGSSQTY